MKKQIELMAENVITRTFLKWAGKTGGRLAKAVEILDKFGILKLILPEVSKMKGYEHNKKYHPEGSVWQHSVAALRASNAVDPIINLAILFHDIGKPDVYVKKGTPGSVQHTYFRHARRSFELVGEICDRIGIIGKDKEAIEFAVLNHMKMHQIMNMSPKKVVALAKSPHWDVLADVARADQMAKGKRSEESFQRMVDRAMRFVKTFGKPQAKKLVSGYTVMKITGLKPGIRVGEIIERVSGWIERNNIKDRKQIENYIRSIKK